MNILIHGYNTCCQNHMGGLQGRARKIKQLLEEKGNNVSFFAPFESKLAETDILHVFMATVENYNLIKCAKAKGCKVILSSIINLNNGFILDIVRKSINIIPKLVRFQKMYFELYKIADFIITETQKEKNFISKHLAIEPNKITVIPNGVDLMPKYEGQEIREFVKGEYILTVGRFDKNKNQLKLIKAMKNTNIELVFVGGADFSDEGKKYYKECLKEAETCKNIHFLGWQDANSPLLKSAYANANLLVLPSQRETFGMVLLEGALAGAKIAMSNTLPILEYSCFKNCNTFNPNNIEDIRKKVIKAYEEEKSEVLRKQVIETFSWDRIINQHLDLYERLLNHVK